MIALLPPPLPRLVRLPTRRSGSRSLEVVCILRKGRVHARGCRDAHHRRQLAYTSPPRPARWPALLRGPSDPLLPIRVGSATQVFSWQHVSPFCYRDSSVCRLNRAGCWVPSAASQRPRHHNNGLHSAVQCIAVQSTRAGLQCSAALCSAQNMDTTGKLQVNTFS